VAKLAGKYRTGTDEKKHLLCRSEPNAPEGCFSSHGMRENVRKRRPIQHNATKQPIF
jgi:hypothetical protein